MERALAVQGFHCARRREVVGLGCFLWDIDPWIESPGPRFNQKSLSKYKRNISDLAPSRKGSRSSEQCSVSRRSRVADAVPRPLIVDDDDIERMMLQDTPQRDPGESVVASKASNKLVIVTFFAVGFILLVLFLLVWLWSQQLVSGYLELGSF
jgi:hypothetical protein